ncbi:MAG: FAD-binding protein, partial [Gemmatimonadales bacterium]
MSARVETDADIRAMVSADASGLRYLPDAVARPESVEEVSEVLKSAAAARTPVTPAGMQTSTTGASIADGGILLSMRSLTTLSVLSWSSREGIRAAQHQVHSLGGRLTYTKRTYLYDDPPEKIRAHTVQNTPLDFVEHSFVLSQARDLY